MIYRVYAPERFRPVGESFIGGIREYTALPRNETGVRSLDRRGDLGGRETRGPVRAGEIRVRGSCACNEGGGRGSRQGLRPAHQLLTQSLCPAHQAVQGQLRLLHLRPPATSWGTGLSDAGGGARDRPRGRGCWLQG